MTEKHWQDPIVAEVRDVREALFAEAGHDIHEFCGRLREREQASGRPVIRARQLRRTALDTER